MNLKERAQAEELMDDPALPADTLRAVLDDLAQVNVVTMAARPTLDFLARATRGMSEFRLLDVGYGDGDMLRRIARWARKRGIRAHLTGIDQNLNARPAAQARSESWMPIRWEVGSYTELNNEPFDFIISSLVAHHMSDPQLQLFLGFMERYARVGWFINDLHRHRFAYWGFPILARLAGWHPIVRHDGRLSIARSYRPAEWPPILASRGIEGARMFRAFPFRLCVERIRDMPLALSYYP